MRQRSAFQFYLTVGATQKEDESGTQVNRKSLLFFAFLYYSKQQEELQRILCRVKQVLTIFQGNQKSFQNLSKGLFVFFLEFTKVSLICSTKYI